MKDKYRLGKVIYNPQSKQLDFSGHHSTQLNSCENCVLQLLIDNPFTLITAKEIYRRCFIYFMWRRNSIHQIIKQLSRKLADANYIDSPIDDCYQFNFTAIKVVTKNNTQATVE